MSAYYDTGALLPFYVNEVFTGVIVDLVERRREAIPLNLFQQLELENALQLKVFRGELNEAQCRAVLVKIQRDVAEGKIVMRAVDWINALADARRLGARVTPRSGCRTLDLLHVAIAAQWASDPFVTADDRQLKAARAAGLRVVDARTLPDTDTPPRATRGSLRERRAKYGTRR